MEFQKDDQSRATAESKDNKKMMSLRISSDIAELIESMTEMYSISQSKLISTLVYAYANDISKEELEKQLVFHKAIN